MFQISLSRILALSLLAGVLPSCRSTEPGYGYKTTPVTITTRAQKELLDSSPGVTAHHPDVARLGADVFVLTLQVWMELEGEDHLTAVRLAAREDDPQRSKAALEALLKKLERFRRGEGRTPVTIPMVKRVHMVVAARDGRVEAIRFNPDHHNLAVVGL